MLKLINWTAKRAGGRITINGIEQATMKPLKVVGVDMIEAGVTTIDGIRDARAAIATDRHGAQYELA